MGGDFRGFSEGGFRRFWHFLRCAVLELRPEISDFRKYVAV